MIRKCIYISVLVFFAFNITIKAQDIHFSQFFSSPLYTNPANTANFEGDYRFVINNKNQWTSFTNAYTTFAGSVDAGFDNFLLDGSHSGVGLLINNDVAGDGRLGTSQFYLTSAFYLPLDKEQTILAGLGLNIGYVMHGIDYNNFSFGNQYSGEQFDGNLPSGEVWAFDKINYFDFGAGLNFIYTPKEQYSMFLGASASHINTPEKTFSDISDSYLHVKWTVNAGGEYNVKDDLWVEPLFLVLLQQKYSEYNFGALMRLDYNPVSLQSIYFGGLVRASDAGIVCFGLKYQNLKIMINYDINLSKLSTISRGRGGVEFSLIYIFLKPRPFESPYYRKCPDFI